MSTQLATVPLNTQNIERSPLTSVQDDFVILDKYSPDGMAQFEEPRINAIATVSAGYRTDNNQVARTTDGTMFVHGDAPGLLEALQKRDRKALTIMFPSDNPRVFIQQRFTEYSATELKAYGDEKEITVIDRGQRVTYAVGSSGYAAALTRCKVAVSVYFTLAEWTKENEGGGCDMVFPDGFGMYRLRFTSMNSLRSILSSVRHMANTTGGKIAGIPFELFLREEEHSDPTGKKRRVWIWQCLPKPPMGIRLTPVVFRAIMESGQNQRQMLQLQAPASETMELAARDGQTLDLDTGEIVDAETVSVNANATNAQDADRVL